MMTDWKFYEAVATLTGCVIGAGILGIPYVVSKSGFWIGLFWMILLGFSVLVMNLYLGEIALRTKGFHQLTGYAEKYFGKKGRFFMTISMFLGIYGALLAYIIGVGESLNAIFPSITAFNFSLIFFAVVSIIILFGLKWVKNAELFFGAALLIVVSVIIYYSFVSKHFNLSFINFTSWPNFFLPYGVILFAYLGEAAIPEMREELLKKEHLMKKAIIVGSIIPIIVYVLFSFTAVSVLDGNISEVSTISLGKVLGFWMLVFANLFAIFAMTTSFMSLGLALKEMYEYDYHLNKYLSWFVTILLPLVLFVFGLTSFINTLWISGSFAGAINGVMIVLMHWKCKTLRSGRKPEYSIRKSYVVGTFLIIIFVIGAIYQIASVFT
jgi:amino acid permease